MQEVTINDLRPGLVFRKSSPLNDIDQSQKSRHSLYRVVLVRIESFRRSWHQEEEKDGYIELLVTSDATTKEQEQKLVDDYHKDPTCGVWMKYKGHSYSEYEFYGWRERYFCDTGGPEYINRYFYGLQPLMLWTLEADHPKADEWRQKYKIHSVAVNRSSFTVMERWEIEDGQAMQMALW